MIEDLILVDPQAWDPEEEVLLEVLTGALLEKSFGHHHLITEGLENSQETERILEVQGRHLLEVHETQVQVADIWKKNISPKMDSVAVLGDLEDLTSRGSQERDPPDLHIAEVEDLVSLGVEEGAALNTGQDSSGNLCHLDEAITTLNRMN